jgi:hypothetical protein
VIFNSPFWPRPRFQPGGGDALVALEVCGEFPTQIQTDFAIEGVQISVETNDFARFGEVAAEMLRQSNPQIASAIESAPQVVSIRGIVPDPPDLEYLRHTLGFVHELLQNGGIGVVDPQTLQQFSPSEWENGFWSGAFEPTSHATILLSPQDDKIWLHTRGMRIFGRPDISCHDVLPEEVEKLQPVFNGLIRMMAAGAIIPGGQVVQAVGIETSLICRQKGDLSDPNFSNFHLELEWETPRL